MSGLNNAMNNTNLNSPAGQQSSNAAGLNQNPLTSGSSSSSTGGINANGDFVYRKPQPLMPAAQMLVGDLAAKSGIPLSMTNTQAAAAANAAVREAAKKAAQANSGFDSSNNNTNNNTNSSNNNNNTKQSSNNTPLKVTEIKPNEVYNNPLFDNELGKLVFGLVFSLRGISKKLVGTPSSTNTNTKSSNSNTDSSTSPDPAENNGLATIAGTPDRFFFQDPNGNVCTSNGALSNNSDSFVSFSTSKYKLHYYETPSNIRFVLITDPSMESQVHVLKHIYSSVYLDYAVKNPLFPIDATGSAVLSSDLLVIGIESYITSLPHFE